MSDSEHKKEYFKALGLKQLDEHEKLIRALKTTLGNQRQSKSSQKIRERPVRRARATNGMRTPMSPYFSDWKLAKKPSRNSSTKSPRKKAEESVNTASALAKSPPLQQGQNLLLLPKQASPQKTVQAQPNIVIGQTIFQAPDGKKFILIPNSAAKQSPQGGATLSKGQNQTPILPLTGNVKIQNNKDSGTLQRFLYVPQGHAVLSAANAGLPRNVTIANVARKHITTNIPPPHGVSIDGKLQQQTTTTTTSTATATTQSNISPNIMHLLNMTNNVLNETQSPAGAVSVSQIPAPAANLATSRSLIPSSSVNLVSGSTVSLVPASHLIPASSASLGAWHLAGNQNNLQVVRIRSSDAIQLQREGLTQGASTTTVNQLPKCIYVTATSINSSHLASSANNAPVLSLSVVPKRAAIQGSVSKVAASSSQVGIVGIVNGAMENNTSLGAAVAPVSAPIASSEIICAQSLVPVMKSQKLDENVENNTRPTNDTQVGLSCENIKDEDTHSLSDGIRTERKRPVKYVGDPDRNLRNTETNCVVILGKKRRKKLGFKGSGTVLHRRYGGPPFMPCKVPPAPHTPSSATCCLYEHTLLKMATRGFWGCEMGKLQDVFRSIRCESIDQDTVEDVTKRCYGFVQRRLLQAGDDCKSMYRYMKNYIDEFDGFLDRVYPVAIIAMLIYLPTAADYSLVTWHGIPPTGWSEYRRAVVMREVFEVIYRFWNELGTVPDYEKEFFDCPVKSSLLVPRVFDLRQNYSHPTTCVVQKVPQIERASAGNQHKESASNAEFYEKDGQFGGLEREIGGRSEKTLVSDVLNGGVASPKETIKMDVPKMSSMESDVADSFVPQEDVNNTASMERWCFKSEEPLKPLHNSEDRTEGLDDLLITVRPRESSPDDLDFSIPESSNSSWQITEGVSDLKSDALDDKEAEVVVSEAAETETQAINGTEGDEPMTDCLESDEMSDRGKVVQAIMAQIELRKLESEKSSNRGGEFSTYLQQATKSGTISSKDQNDNSTLLKSLPDASEGVVCNSTGRKIISAKFAESIAAACGNNASWNENAGNEDRGDIFPQTVRSETAIATTTTTATNMEGITLATTATAESELRGKSELPALSRASEIERNSNDIEIVEDNDMAMQRRRTRRRLASSTRFDLLVATDDVSLERDLRKAIKLSKLESNAKVATDNASNILKESFLTEKSNELKKSERAPLKTSLKVLRNGSDLEHQGDNSDESPIKKLNKLKRSVAFEALWTQKSVEEPIVILDEKKFSLGEFLENFPIETHGPPEKTIIRICNEDYNAREVLGYLRRGTQLVEQVGEEVVIDTTRTVKSNSTILAVRKVPPGKISKLVHPELHLENYTGYILPLGIKHPLKGRRGLGKAAKVKRKSSTSKEEVTIKSEPLSPSVSSSPFKLNNFEESSNVTPPPQKTARLEDDVKDKDAFAADVGPEVHIQAETACKETQTTDLNGNHLSGLANANKITDIKSLEEALNTMLESALAGLTESDMATKCKDEDVFDSLIQSYVRAGNFLLNTAKILNKMKVKSCNNNAE